MNDALFLWIPGLILLFAGRQFFWLAVALIGFVFGLEVAAQASAGQPEWVQWLAAVFIGLLAAVLAVFFKRAAIALFGLVGGAFLVLQWFQPHLPADPAWIGPTVLVGGGLAGAILASMLFDPLLVVITALSGAAVLAPLIPIDPSQHLWLIPVLGAVGMAMQFGLLKAARREPKNN